MATENNRLNTRILLKYDTYANWTANNPVLLAGEVAIATIESGNLQTVNPNGVDTPQVLIKVGNGTSNYNDLKFVSGLAADVYSWAKASTKPTYKANEISGLSDYIATAGDTNTEYKLVTVDAATYKYKLQTRAYAGGKWGEWTDVENGALDLSAIDTRLDTAESNISKNASAITKLNAAADQTGSVLNTVNTKIQTLNADVSQEAGLDGLALNVVEANGVITTISGSIKANTYDAYGSAAAVQGGTSKTVKDVEDAAVAAKSAADAAKKAAEDEAAARVAAIQGLDYTEYVSGNDSGSTISFVGTISEADGVISATKRDLVFQSSYDPSTNKAATMADITGAVADLNGAMHFEGVSTSDPIENGVTINGKPDYVAAAGDVVIYGIKEYVYDGSKWVELGDEGSAAAQIQALDVADITVGADNTLSVVGQTDGYIHATPVKIQIAQSQVTGLVDALTNGSTKDGEQDTAIKANEDAIKAINGDDTGKSMRAVAGEVASAQIGDLNKPDTAVAGEYVSAVSQSNGIITVSRAKLPTIPDLVHTDSTATTPTVESVSVIADIDVSGHTITDTRVNVATTAGVAAAIAKLDADKNVSSTKHVMTGVTEVDGVLTSIDQVELADIAFSGNVADLKQTAETYIVFDCGSSTKNI